MARRPRIEFPGALYHTYSRGNSRNHIFHSDADFRAFLRLLKHVIDEHGWVIHSYCLMPNHYHLLLETPGAMLSSGMKILNGAYAQRFNKKYGEVGHLFQGRFNSKLIDKDDYFMALLRYINMNPVDARIVPFPCDWKWSSCRALLRQDTEDLCCNPGFALSLFGSDPHEARLQLEDFILNSRPLDVPDEYLLDDKVDYCDRPGLAQLLDRSVKTRFLAGQMHDAHAEYGYSIGEIADFLEINATTVRRAIGRHKSQSRQPSGGKTHETHETT